MSTRDDDRARQREWEDDVRYYAWRHGMPEPRDDRMNDAFWNGHAAEEFIAEQAREETVKRETRRLEEEAEEAHWAEQETDRQAQRDDDTPPSSGEEGDR